MTVSAGFLELVRELCAQLGHITVRKMFGGASIYDDGIHFALVDDDVLYLKADDTTKLRYIAAGLKPFTYDGMTGPVSMSYWRAPERLFDEPDEMLEWAREAICVAATRLRAAKKKTPASKKPASFKSSTKRKSR